MTVVGQLCDSVECALYVFTLTIFPSLPTVQSDGDTITPGHSEPGNLITGLTMKGKIHALVLVLGCAAVSQAHAEWFDLSSGPTGFYAGGGLHVVKVNGLLDRRLGGPNDPGGFRIDEPGYNTVAQLRGGWQVFPFLGVEAQYGLALDSDDIDNADNSQKLKLNALYGIYLKPRLAISDSFALVGSLGYNDFDYDIKRAENASADDDNASFGSFSDSGFAWGGALQLQLSPAVRLAFEYNQHYDKDDVDMFDAGFAVTYVFGQDDGGYY
ncbi:MAG: porin family protein [Oceanococcus sp.]|nr:MAG: porin family protein [Oceanococcus sp.]